MGDCEPCRTRSTRTVGESDILGERILNRMRQVAPPRVCLWINTRKVWSGLTCWNRSFSGAIGQRSGKVASDAMAAITASSQASAASNPDRCRRRWCSASIWSATRPAGRTAYTVGVVFPTTGKCLQAVLLNGHAAPGIVVCLTGTKRRKHFSFRLRLGQCLIYQCDERVFGVLAALLGHRAHSRFGVGGQCECHWASCLHLQQSNYSNQTRRGRINAKPLYLRKEQVGKGRWG